MADDRRRKQVGGAAVLALLVAVIAWARCSKDPNGTSATTSSSSEPPSEAPSGARASPGGPSAPLAAAHIGEDVVVAALDLSAGAIRVQRIDPKDTITANRLVLFDLAWSPDADLKVSASPEGVAVTWRGLRSGKLVRQLVVMGPDLAPRGEPVEVAATSCATGDTLWSSDGTHAMARPWAGSPSKIRLPKDKDVSLLCGAHRAFAVLEEEENISLLALGDGGAPITMIREREFGEDDQRELSEYTVGDDVGFVRLAVSGAIALRELVNRSATPLHKLKTTIGRDDDVVAVDASPRIAVIVYTEEATEPPDAASSEPGASPTCTKILALRVDRQTFEESTAELSAGRCGHEVGPFFTSAVDDGVAIAWPERTGGAGRARAPIVALAHALVGPTAAPVLSRTEHLADALVDAGCHGTHCFAVGLAHREGPDAASLGVLKVLRYR